MSKPETLIELRNRPVNELTPDELWIAYGLWLKKLANRVASRYPGVEPESLWGPGFEAMLSSAQYWRPGKGSGFCNFCSRLVIPAMEYTIFQELLPYRPRPKSAKTEDPCQGFASRDQAEILAAQQDSYARPLLGRIHEAAKEQSLGNFNLMEISPEEAVDLRRLMEETETRIKHLYNTPDKSRRKMAIRLREVLLKGRDGKEVAVQQGVSRQAVSNSICAGRFLLQDLIGYPQVTLEEATSHSHTFRRKRWSRNKSEEIRKQEGNLRGRHGRKMDR